MSGPIGFSVNGASGLGNQKLSSDTLQSSRNSEAKLNEHKLTSDIKVSASVEGYSRRVSIAYTDVYNTYEANSTRGRSEANKLNASSREYGVTMTRNRWGLSLGGNSKLRSKPVRVSDDEEDREYWRITDIDATGKVRTVSKHRGGNAHQNNEHEDEDGNEDEDENEHSEVKLKKRTRERHLHFMRRFSLSTPSGRNYKRYACIATAYGRKIRYVLDGKK